MASQYRKTYSFIRQQPIISLTGVDETRSKKTYALMSGGPRFGRILMDPPYIPPPPPPPAAVLSIYPVAWDFGSIDVGTTVVKTFIVSNAIGKDISGPITVFLIGDDPVQIIDLGTGTLESGVTTLAADESATIDLQFAPSSGGSKTATLSVDATPGGDPSSDLTGTAIVVDTLESVFGSRRLIQLDVRDVSSLHFTSPTAVNITSDVRGTGPVVQYPASLDYLSTGILGLPALDASTLSGGSPIRGYITPAIVESANDYLIGMVLETTDTTAAFNSIIDFQSGRLLVTTNAWYTDVDDWSPDYTIKTCPKCPQVFIAEFSGSIGSLYSYTNKTDVPGARAVDTYTQRALKGSEVFNGFYDSSGNNLQGKWGELCIVKAPVVGDRAKMAEILLREWAFPTTSSYDPKLRFGSRLVHGYDLSDPSRVCYGEGYTNQINSVIDAGGAATVLRALYSYGAFYGSTAPPYDPYLINGLRTAGYGLGSIGIKTGHAPAIGPTDLIIGLVFKTTNDAVYAFSTEPYDNMLGHKIDIGTKGQWTIGPNGSDVWYPVMPSGSPDVRTIVWEMRTESGVTSVYVYVDGDLKTTDIVTAQVTLNTGARGLGCYYVGFNSVDKFAEFVMATNPTTGDGQWLADYLKAKWKP